VKSRFWETVSVSILVSILVLSSLTRVRAGGDTTQRVAHSTSLYTCPGTIFETYLEHGNVSQWGAHLTLVCLQRPNYARWILYSGVECDVSKDPNQKCQGKSTLPLTSQVISFNEVKPSVQGREIRNRYKLPKAIVGEFCVLKNDGIEPETGQTNQLWYCEKYSKLDSTHLITVGTTGMLPSGVFHHRLYDPSYMSGFVGGMSNFGRLNLP
jgi:hypothetical protein